MSDDEFYLQISKIFIGVVFGILVLFVLWKINHNLTTLITLMANK